MSWVYRLNKDHVIEQLTARNVVIGTTSKSDVLRKALVKSIRENAEKPTESETEMTSTSSTQIQQS